MQQLMTLTFMLLVWTPSATCTKPDRFGSCLPKNIQLNSVVQGDPANDATRGEPKPVTIQQKLIELKAKCKNGKLFDLTGKEIYFVQLIGCWGNPPEDYQEQLDRQQQELKRLKEKYTVIEISCAQGDQRKVIAD
jgi:hypothetical protein